MPVVRDTPIGSALAYICFRRWGPSFLDAAEAEPRAEANVALDDFLRAAAVGAAQVWGKTHRDGAFERIDKGYWREHTIDRLSLLQGRPFTKRALGTRRAAGMVDLMTSKAQVETLWPPLAGYNCQSERPSIDLLAATRSASSGRETVGGRKRCALVRFKGNLLGEHDIAFNEITFGNKTPADPGHAVFVELFDVCRRSLPDAIRLSRMATNDVEVTERVILGSLIWR